MRASLVLRVAAGAIVAFASACSSSPPPDPYASPSGFCAAYAKAICQISSTCQFDTDACDTYQTGVCAKHAAETMAPGTRQYKSANVQPCIDALNHAYGNGATSISASALSDLESTCEAVFVGTAGEGQPCATAYDCATSGAVCAAAPGMKTVCAPSTAKKDGDFCADPGDECPSSDYCQSSTLKCVPAAIENQACSASLPCDGNDHCVGGICRPLSKMGDPCSTGADCATGLYCDTYTSSIVPEPACVTALTFARASVDCLGIEGQADAGVTPVDGGADGGSDGAADGGADGADGGSGDAASDGPSDGGHE